MSEDDLQRQLIVLREMGFRDASRNVALLRATGDVERTIATLIKMDEREARSASSKPTPTATRSNKPTPADTSFPSESEVARSQSSRASNNPFDRAPAGSSSTQGLSSASMQLPQSTGRSYQSEPRDLQSNNPFGMPARSQTDQGLTQAFQGMQVSEHLFPHSTGGNLGQAQLQQDTRFQYSMSPPVPIIPQQYGYAASPKNANNANPFFQSGPLTQNVGISPHVSELQQQPTGPPSNPFFSQSASIAQPQHFQQAQQPISNNPFGIPPQLPPQQLSQQQPSPQLAFDYSQQPTQQVSQQQQPHPVFDYPQQAQHQTGYASQPMSSQQMPQTQNNNPYAQQLSQYQQHSAFQQQPAQYQAQFQAQSQPLMPQQTGRYDKSSILALYNYPQLAPQQPLESIPEPADGQGMTPAMGAETGSQKRSVTIPVSSMHSAGGGGNRNPFFNDPSSGLLTPMAQTSNVRHASAESVQINNFQNGRHSPDAFASLSARYMR